MTGPEHYLEAERLLDVAKTAVGEQRMGCLLAGQIHAALAQAAATALNDNEPGMPVDDLNQWRDAVGTNLQKGAAR